jgi:hypothetical protein
MEDNYKLLAMKEIIDTVGRCTLSCQQRCTRANLIAAINNSMDDIKISLDEACRVKRKNMCDERDNAVKRRRMDKVKPIQVYSNTLSVLQLPLSFLDPVEEQV